MVRLHGPYGVRKNLLDPQKEVHLNEITDKITLHI